MEPKACSVQSTNSILLLVVFVTDLFVTYFFGTDMFVIDTKLDLLLKNFLLLILSIHQTIVQCPDLKI